MFKAIRLGLVIVFVCLLASASFGEERYLTTTDPDPKLFNLTLDGGWSVSAWGYASGTYQSNPVKGTDRWDANCLRLYGFLQSPDKRLSLFTEVEVVHADEEDSNWLRHFQLSYQLTPEWELAVGRKFLDAPYFTTPYSRNLETVHYPREPWNYYGYSVSMDGKFKDGWHLMFDVSLRSGVPFDSEENFDHLETSGLVEKKLSNELTTGVAWQISPKYQRFGAYGKYNPTNRLGFRAEIYGSNEEDYRLYGGYFYSGYQLTRWMEVHGQADYQYRSSHNGGSSWILTPGIRIFTPDNRIWLIVDYEQHINDDLPSGLWGKLMFRF